MIRALHARNSRQYYRPVCNTNIAVPAFAATVDKVTCRRCLASLNVPVDPRDDLVNAALAWAANEIAGNDLRRAVGDYKRIIND